MKGYKFEDEIEVRLAKDEGSRYFLQYRFKKRNLIESFNGGWRAVKLFDYPNAIGTARKIKNPSNDVYWHDYALDIEDGGLVEFRNLKDTLKTYGDLDKHFNISKHVEKYETACNEYEENMLNII